MLRVVSFMGLFLFVMSAACVDRLNFDVGDVKDYALVVEGYVTNDPGPYEVRVSTTYDVDSTVVKRTGPPIKRLVLSDDAGNFEELKGDTGIYRTSETGIQGTIGRAYKLTIELADGRIYESIPDTMKPTGVVEAIDEEIVQYKDAAGVTNHGFDVFFDASPGASTDFRFMWKVDMTYRIQTQPWDVLGKCPFGNSNNCLAPLDCSGYIVVMNQLVYLKPCTCCDCWISVEQDAPIVSDYGLMNKGTVKHLYAGRLPITWFTMNYGTHVVVEQYSLSQQAYEFWRKVRIQQDALNSLSQPVNGKIPGNWVQTAGNEKPVMGLFYASAVNRKSIHLGFANLPDSSIVPPSKLYPIDCKDLPNTKRTPTKYWRAQ